MNDDALTSRPAAVGTPWAFPAPEPSERPEPSSGNGADAAPVTAGCKCGAGPHPERPDRCAAGHVLTGNGLAVVAGNRSVAFWTEHERERRALQRAIVEDAGQTLAAAPRALLVAADGLAQAVLVRDSAFARVVESGGPLTSAGRTRRAFNVWTAAADRVERHVRLLGLKREPKPAPTLAETLGEGGERA